MHVSRKTGNIIYQINSGMEKTPGEEKQRRTPFVRQSHLADCSPIFIRGKNWKKNSLNGVVRMKEC
jgi:hypothetical protein